MNKTQQFAWHSSNEYFGLISDNNHVIIYDTKNNEKIQDFVLPFNLSTTFTSISFSPMVIPNFFNFKSQEKKKKKKSGIIQVACGTSKGTVVVWNVSKGVLFCHLETEDPKPAFVTFSDSSNLLVSTPNLVGTFFLEEKSKIQ
jgi:WD40 repeat protein